MVRFLVDWMTHVSVAQVKNDCQKESNSKQPFTGDNTSCSVLEGQIQHRVLIKLFGVALSFQDFLLLCCMQIFE